MLTCIACSKQLSVATAASRNVASGPESPIHDPDGEGTGNGAATPSTRQAIKALTSQIRDMALKASGAYRHCKPCAGASGGSQRLPHHHVGYTDSEMGSASDRFHYAYRRAGMGSGSSPPAAPSERELDMRLKAISSAERTPSVSGRTEASSEAASAFLEDGQDEPKEWVAQVEPGVLITFLSLPQGGNDLKRIRFRYSLSLPTLFSALISGTARLPGPVTAFLLHEPTRSHLHAKHFLYTFEPDLLLNKKVDLRLYHIIEFKTIQLLQIAENFHFDLTKLSTFSTRVKSSLLPASVFIFASFGRSSFIFNFLGLCAWSDLFGGHVNREMFNKWQAQRWWAENCDKVMELYNVQRVNRQTMPLPNPQRSEDEVKEECPICSKDRLATPPLGKELLPHNLHRPLMGGGGIGYSPSDSLEQHQGSTDHNHGHLHHVRHYYDSGGLTSTPKLSSISGAKTEISSMDASVRTCSSPDEVEQSGEISASISNASDLEREWVEEDEPGVYITIRELPGGIRELRRVRFSRERFGEMHARLWWEENRARIQEQYL
ncbi:hypothetical protein ZIOFF_010500 [Zingiber officinale]|uniref:BRX domain-containing protein n=1 Tax=Zingiber officinale TaxID=94328 RepID=A0A8J5LK13_ZINOF|nr:hypothetical protein ZIOFF_010500 [Zingiber officinale]